MVIEYLNNGHTQEEAKRELGISIPSMTNWRRKLRETGNLEDKERRRNPHKLPDEELKAYIAAHFSCSDEGVRKACRRLGITRKKKTRLYRERDEMKRQEFIDKTKDISP